MLERFKKYFSKLERLSNDELDCAAGKLVERENTCVAKLIAHLAEMSSRKTALELGYRSLYHYCQERLNLSEGAVPARIHVANVSRRFPQILAGLAEGRISLTVASLLAPHLTEDNVDKLLSDCAGMTRRETEEYLVILRPKPVFEPSIRKRPSHAAPAVPAPSSDSSKGPALSLPPASPSPPLEATNGSKTVLQPARPDVFNFRFSADRAFKEKFERLVEVLGVEGAEKHMAEILERALDIALEKKDPKKKLERRQKRKKAVKASSRSNEVAEKGEDELPMVSRHIPSEVRERVTARSGHQCEFKSEDGTRCTARTGLQIDHSRPFALFPSHDERFLRVLCRAHNLLMAERVYGRDFIQRKIARASGGAVSAPLQL